MRYMLLLLVIAGMRFPLQAESPSFGQILSGSCDSKAVQVCGTVIDARRDEIDPDVLAIILAREGESIVVTVDARSHSNADCDALIGQRISLDGICTPNPRRSRRHRAPKAPTEDLSGVHSSLTIRFFWRKTYSPANRRE